jgi:hypothetical protein
MAQTVEGLANAQEQNRYFHVQQWLEIASYEQIVTGVGAVFTSRTLNVLETRDI